MRVLLTTLAFLISSLLFAQAPALIPYQAIARDASGQPLANTNVNARFTIHDGSAAGVSVWQELQTVNTSALGLFTSQLGLNVPLANVNWGEGVKFLQVELDLGNGFIDIGTQQMLSVPYALHAGSVHLEVSVTGDTLFVGDGSFVIVPGISNANANILGCMNPNACNYNAEATVEDGSCYSIGESCNDNNEQTVNDMWNVDCTCQGAIEVIANSHSCGAPNVHNWNLPYGYLYDQQGNLYQTIQIGTQEWMAENLKTSIYSNGDPIPNVADSAQWSNLSTGAWCYYNNNASHNCPYGKLYNWYSVVDSRNVCPLGWHVPSDDEWSILINFLDITADGGNNTNIAGGVMKTIGMLYWMNPNQDATNESGFSALPGGWRYPLSPFEGNGFGGHWWSSTGGTGNLGFLWAWARSVYAYDSNCHRWGFEASKRFGFSVRCVRD